MPKPGDVIAHKYHIERLVGSGGMGAVFEARHMVIGRTIALKWLKPDFSSDPDAIHRLIREARAAARVEHPNVLAVHDVGEHDGALFLVMDYLRGRSLEAVLSQGPLPWRDAVSLLLPAMRGVVALHARGVLHRDLKPANIFLCEDDEGRPLGPKVLDFGISKIVDSRYEDGASTATGSQLGTPTYMSPEQLRGERAVDPQVDVYAFGVILYRALSGRLPFTGATPAALAIKVATTDPPSITSLRPNIPPALAAVVEKAMARERENRYENMTALVAALEPFETASGGARGSVPPPETTGAVITETTKSALTSVATERRTHVPRAVLSAAAVGLVVIVFMVAQWFGHRPQASTPSGASNAGTATAVNPNPLPPPGATNALPVEPASHTLPTTADTASSGVKPAHAGATAKGRPKRATSAPQPSDETPRPKTVAPSTSGEIHLKTEDF